VSPELVGVIAFLAGVLLRRAETRYWKRQASEWQECAAGWRVLYHRASSTGAEHEPTAAAVARSAHPSTA
jgi:hypothetical protein